jgi:hypothetical protein
MSEVLPQELAMEIYNCHAEIIRAKTLLEELEAFLVKDSSNPEVLRDAFGRQQNELQLGIPSGQSSHRLIRLSPKLGKYIIEAHLADTEAELVKLSLQAALALRGATP